MPQWRIAFRHLSRKPAFTVAATLLLAAAIAANATVCSLVATIFLKPLPYPDPDRLVAVYETNPGKKETTSLIAPVRLEDWHRLNQTFATISGFYSDTKTDRTGETPERVRALMVSPRYFAVYSAKPIFGRTFNGAEERFGGPNSVVLAYDFSRRRFRAAETAIGSRLRLGTESYTVIGIMPPAFGSSSIDLWLSSQLAPGVAEARAARFFNGVGRLQPGVSAEQAQQDLLRVQRDLGAGFPETDKGWGATVVDLKSVIIGDRARLVWIAFAAAGVLLLLTCTNIAGLMLGQIHQRAHELAVRTSLGATSAQLMAGIGREIVLLVFASTAIGIGSAFLMTEASAKLLTTLPRMAELQLDWRSLVFSVLLSMIACLCIGAIPALQASRSQRVSKSLSKAGRTQAGQGQLAGQLLLLGQFAMAVVLLFSAGLLLRSYQILSSSYAGFNPERVLTFRVGAEWSEDRTAIGAIQTDIITALQASPGVMSVGITNFLPTDGATLRYRYRLEGIEGGANDRTVTAGARTVSGGYLSAMQIPVVAGSNCPAVPAKLTEKQSAKALLNRSFAGRFGQGEKLIGRSLQIEGSGIDASFEIIGLIEDVREDSLRAQPVPYVYTCSLAGGWPDPQYVIRTAGSEHSYAAVVRQVVGRIAPGRAIYGFETMQAQVNRSINQPRLTAQIITAFAVTAVLLAACGLYALCTLLVTGKTREIGTRMALGAQQGQIITGLLSGATKVLGAGLALGLLLALWVANLMSSIIYGVVPTDPLTVAAVCGILLLVSLLAMLVPAIRAASVDPVVAIREQ